VSAVIICWNRDKWDGWDTRYELIAAAMANPAFRYRCRWSVGARREVEIGTDAWLLRQGRIRGLIGHGVTLTEPVEDVHFTDPTRTRRYVEVEFDVLLDERDVIPPEVLQAVVPEVAWPSQFQSGNSVPSRAEARLLALWRDHVSSLR
jgi:hypothetical protein